MTVSKTESKKITNTNNTVVLRKTTRNNSVSVMPFENTNITEGLIVERTSHPKQNQTNKPQEIYLQSGRKIVIQKLPDGRSVRKYFAADGSPLKPDYFKKVEGEIKVSADGKSYTATKGGITKKINTKNPAEAKIAQQQAELNKAKKEQGFIGRSWDWIKNKTGIGDSSGKAQKQIDFEKKLLKQIQSGKVSKNYFKEVTGLDCTQENIQKFKNGKLNLKSAEKVQGYKEGQEIAVDITSDIVAGVVSYGTAATCIAGGIAAAPFTAGASLGAVATGVGIAAGAGAAIKVAIKGAEAYTGGKKYSLKQAGKDATIGSISGTIAPFTIGAGGVAANAIGKVAPKWLVTSARFSVEGGLFGGADGATRSALEGESVGDVAIAGLKGVGAGIIAGNVFGHGGNAIAKGYNTAFPKIADNGYGYRQIFNKKYNVKLARGKYEKINIQDNRIAIKNVKNPHPENLEDELKRCIYSPWDVHNLLYKNPQLCRSVGKLPGYSKEASEEVDKVLSKYAVEFHKTQYLGTDFVSKMSKELSDILGSSVKVKFLGMGKVGKTCTIEIDGNKYVYKMYYTEPLQAGISETNGHGNYPELLNAIRANVDDEGHFAKLYMGKFGENKDGYILSQFVADTENPIINKNVKFSNFAKRMQTDDPSPDNVINGIIRDYGASGYTTFGKMSKEAQALTENVLNALDKSSDKELQILVTNNKNKKEFKEMLTYFEKIKENCFDDYPELFASRKDLFKMLGIDYKPDIRAIINKHKESIVAFFNEKEYQDFLKYYGLKQSQWQDLINECVRR